MCKYCEDNAPLNIQEACGYINELEDNAEIEIQVLNERGGYEEIYMKINYCPICGRKLIGG